MPFFLNRVFVEKKKLKKPNKINALRKKTNDLKICEGAMGCLREQSIEAINVFHSDISSRKLAALAELADRLQLLPLCLHHGFHTKTTLSLLFAQPVTD